MDEGRRFSCSGSPAERERVLEILREKHREMGKLLADPDALSLPTIRRWIGDYQFACRYSAEILGDDWIRVFDMRIQDLTRRMRKLEGYKDE